MHSIASIILLLSLISPTHWWFTPQQPVSIEVNSQAPVTLVLTDFFANPYDAKAPNEFTGNTTVDLEHIYPVLRNTPNCYLLFTVPKGKELKDFEGTPLVINVLADKRRGAPPGPMITRIEPLQYAELNTELGNVDACFYYDAAPNTVDSFIRLASTSFYDGMTFFRVVPNFIIQTGDPRGDGTGNAGFNINAEFSDRKHLEGVLSMARMSDPNEPRLPPRPEFANSAGSQFFICLNYENTKQLDSRYTAFGRVVDGLPIVQQIGKSPRKIGIQKIQIKPVTSAYNPYAKLKITAPATQATTK